MDIFDKNKTERIVWWSNSFKFFLTYCISHYIYHLFFSVENSHARVFLTCSYQHVWLQYWSNRLPQRFLKMNRLTFCVCVISAAHNYQKKVKCPPPPLGPARRGFWDKPILYMAWCLFLYSNQYSSKYVNHLSLFPVQYTTSCILSAFCE